MNVRYGKSYGAASLLMYLLALGCAAQQSHMVKIDQAELQRTERIGVRVQYCEPHVNYYPLSAQVSQSIVAELKHLKKEVKLFTRQKLRKYFISEFSKLINKPLVDITDWQDQLVLNKGGYIDYVRTAQENDLDLIAEVYGCASATEFTRDLTYIYYETSVTVIVKMIRASDEVLVWKAKEMQPPSIYEEDRHYRFQVGISMNIRDAVDNILSRLAEPETE